MLAYNTDIRKQDWCIHLQTEDTIDINEMTDVIYQTALDNNNNNDDNNNNGDDDDDDDIVNNNNNNNNNKNKRAKMALYRLPEYQASDPWRRCRVRFPTPGLQFEQVNLILPVRFRDSLPFGSGEEIRNSCS